MKILVSFYLAVFKNGSQTLLEKKSIREGNETEEGVELTRLNQLFSHAEEIKLNM
jgi:hypothetical protein